ncbi:hypothetical protein Nepgr_003578 [Nepenthes gracilis]|uniref:RING-type domain-containing protein n=1 Tax=Nepenthes gracilis TaxID=150966 RepID=A0AAD3XDT6_NEPGR|nr:hypothetical protein Nepgr_003578 [Nepenthes gracilis]
MDPHEPHWRSNTSFSPPPPRWDYQFQSEGLRYGSNDSIQLFGSSTSPNSKESRSLLRGHCQTSHQYSASDGAGLYFSSPSETSLVLPWTPPPVQEISIDELETSSKRDSTWGSLSFTPTMEGTSRAPDGVGSTSSRSDGSEYEHTAKLHLPTHCNFPSRRSFMSKPIHPLSFPIQTSTKGASLSATEYEITTSHRDTHGSSSGSSSIDLTDILEPFQSENLGPVYNPAEEFKCGLCERFLSQRSPWSSRRIVRSGDLPVAGVLSCRHVFHAECLEQSTLLKARRSDPPCPLCFKAGEMNNSPEQQQQRFFSRSRSNFPRLRAYAEDGPSSRPWGCAQAGDCVEGALCAQQHNSGMLLLNRSRVRKTLSLKGERFIRSRGPGSCSKTAADPNV